MGGVLKVASIGEPPTLDIPMSTAMITYEIMWHVNESLFTYDASFNPVPLLADTHAVSDRGLRHTITLRKGVKFHNGKEMTRPTSSPRSSAGAGRVARQAAVEERREHRGEGRPHGRARAEAAVRLAASSGCRSRRAIYPKEVVEAAGDGPLKDYTGTGPYRFVEHKAGPPHQARPVQGVLGAHEPPNGFGGKRGPSSTRSSSCRSPTRPYGSPASNRGIPPRRCS